MRDKTLEIYVNYKCKDIFVGFLYVNIIKGKEIYSFEYNKDYLEKNYHLILDPELIYQEGRQYKENSSKIYGFLADVIPDRWGKKLILKRERQLAKEENRNVETLGESDYLIRISDYLREGAVRIKEKNTPFLMEDRKDTVPTMLYINSLEKKSYNLDELDEEDIKELFNPGSSLGGARPKAAIYDNDGNQYIAKFSSKLDEYDIPLVEKTTNDLAKACGINVPESKLIKSTNIKNRSIFLVKRFDRNKDERIPYVSAMTLLNAEDGNSSNYSYLDLLDLVKTYSSSPKEDTLELYKRLIFNVLIHNGDDHLRNHGFLISEKGIRLSPAFDLNPSQDATGLTLSIDGNDNSFSIKTVQNISHLFGVTKFVSQKIIQEFQIKLNFKNEENRKNKN